MVALERLVGGPVDRHGRFGAVLNAIEYMVEDKKANPKAVSCLCEAIVALAEAHRLPASTKSKVNNLLDQLRSRVRSAPGR